MSREEYIAILELENAELKKESKEQQQVIKDKSFIIDKLMEENRQLKEELEEIKQPTIFIDTQDMEERYGEQLYYDFLIEQNIDLQQRIDKVIEFNQTIIDGYEKSDMCEYCDGRFAVAEKNLEILKGENK